MNASKAGAQLIAFRIGCGPSTRAALVMQSIDIDLLYCSFKRISSICLYPCHFFASVAFLPKGGVISSTHPCHPSSIVAYSWLLLFWALCRSAKTCHEALGLAKRTPDSSPSKPCRSKLLKFLHQFVSVDPRYSLSFRLSQRLFRQLAADVNPFSDKTLNASFVPG